jgi:hypothetical protein
LNYLGTSIKSIPADGLGLSVQDGKGAQWLYDATPGNWTLFGVVG